MFCNFCENFENSKWPPFLARQKFFQNWEKYSAEISCGSKILSKLLYLARFLRYKHFCVLQFLRKIRKFKMAAIFGETKIFFKIGITTLQRYSSGQKFRRNRSKIQNGRHFGRDKIFLKIGKTTPQRYPAGQKFRRNRSI